MKAKGKFLVSEVSELTSKAGNPFRMANLVDLETARPLSLFLDQSCVIPAGLVRLGTFDLELDLMSSRDGRSFSVTGITIIKG